jgi:isoquinoline 1-oxidoreductase
MKQERLNSDADLARDVSSQPSRRDVLALAGSGLFLFFNVEPLDAFQGRGQPPGMPAGPADFNTYLRIAPDGRVTCFTGKIEMGQGNMTALAQLLAEELDVAYDSVDMVMGDTDLCPYDMGTFGSMSIRQFGPVLRGAGAEARAVLLQMAAEQLQSPVERLQVKAGVVTDSSAPAKRVTYAQLVQGKRIERRLQNVPVKPVKAFTVVGQSPRRKDGLEKVTGKAKYAGDYLPAGVLHARILRPPSREATLKSVDTSAAEKVPGVRVVREGNLIAVLHERRDMADQALGLIKPQFDQPQPAVDDKNIFDHLLKTAPQPRTLAESGNLAEGEKLAATLVEETYLNSYVAHAAMETHSATAAIEGGKATVWASTQTPFPLKQRVAQELGFTPQNVRIITPYVGGGFGGKSAGGQALEAARLAKITGKPVQVVWDRGEEFFYDTFRPAAVIKIRSGATSGGKLILWDYKVYGAGDREAKQFYDIPHQRTLSAGGWSGGNPAGMNPVDVGAWRAPSVNSNTFARESHIDVLAAKLNVDPVAFRLNNLTEMRMRRVLETVAKQFGWKPGRAPSGRGWGVACATDTGSFVATIAEVAVDKRTGHVQVKRVVCAQDQGVIVNEDGSRQQMEGCITMGLGYTLGEEVRFRGSEVLDHNFDTYSIPRFSWVPKIETILIQNPDSPASGCGEPSIAPMGAVVANAIYDAVGARLLQLPMTPARVLEALKRG